LDWAGCVAALSVVVVVFGFVDDVEELVVAATGF
jgi:hypothetical protein